MTSPNPKNPPARRVLVTGASKGIGRGIALKLAADGWKVAVHFGSDVVGAEFTKDGLGPNASGTYKANLTEREEVESLIDQVENDGELTALVNNAGVYLPLDFAAATDSEFFTNLETSYSVNLLAPLILSRAVIRRFQNRGGGKILNVASRVGFKGEAGASIYAATKAALINLTRSLAVELADKQIGVFGIAPGWVDTAMVRDGMNERLASIIATLPLGRMGSVDDCANAAAFLLSDGAAYLSGQVIDINGASYFH